MLRNRDFDGDPALAPIVLLGDDETVEFGGRLTYTLGQRIAVTLSAIHQKRSADVAIYDYEAFRGAIGLSLRL